MPSDLSRSITKKNLVPCLWTRSSLLPSTDLEAPSRTFFCSRSCRPYLMPIPFFSLFLAFATLFFFFSFSRPWRCLILGLGPFLVLLMFDRLFYHASCVHQSTKLVPRTWPRALSNFPRRSWKHHHKHFCSFRSRRPYFMPMIFLFV